MSRSTKRRTPFQSVIERLARKHELQAMGLPTTYKKSTHDKGITVMAILLHSKNRQKDSLNWSHFYDFIAVDALSIYLLRTYT